MNAISTEEARRLLIGGQAKPKNQSKHDELRRMYGRFENVAAWIRKNGHGGKIILPLPPMLTNGGASACHWTTKREYKEAYHAHCDALAYSKLVPPKPAAPPMFARCIVRLYVANRMDDDGANSRRKWPQDWLRGKYIHDDGPEYFAVECEVPVVVPRKEVRIEFDFSASLAA